MSHLALFNSEIVFAVQNMLLVKSEILIIFFVVNFYEIRNILDPN